MSNLDDLYQQVILDHAKTRHGEGTVTREDAVASGHGYSHQLNPICGDEIEVELSTTAAGTLNVRWQGRGCAISMASASVMAELAQDTTATNFQTVEAAFYDLMHSRGRGMADEDVLGDAAAFHGVSRFPARVKCALLAWMAAKDALATTRSHEEER